MRNDFVIWGSSGHAKVLSSLINNIGSAVALLCDNDSRAQSVIPGVPIAFGKLGFEQWLKINRSEYPELRGVVAVGGNLGNDRLKIASYLRQMGLITPSLIHPTAFVDKSATIGQSTQILANTTVAADAVISESCIINNGAIVEHESIVGPGSHLGPGSVLCGLVKVGYNVFVGAGAIVLPRISIGDNAIVGAGSVVTKPVLENQTVLGNPARVIRK